MQLLQRQQIVKGTRIFAIIVYFFHIGTSFMHMYRPYGRPTSLKLDFIISAIVHNLIVSFIISIGLLMITFTFKKKIWKCLAILLYIIYAFSLSFKINTATWDFPDIKHSFFFYLDIATLLLNFFLFIYFSHLEKQINHLV